MRPLSSSEGHFDRGAFVGAGAQLIHQATRLGERAFVAAFRLGVVFHRGGVKLRRIGETAADQLDFGDSRGGPVVAPARLGPTSFSTSAAKVSATVNSPSSTLLAAALTPV